MDEVEEMSCAFDSQNSLYSAYIPFVTNGGLFVRTPHLLPLGTTVKLSVKLMNEDLPYLVATQVVWITPQGAQGNRAPGIGLQFTDEKSHYLREKIETCLAGMLKSNQLTDTI